MEVLVHTLCMLPVRMGMGIMGDVGLMAGRRLACVG